jgi:hypothetical protein
LTPTTLQGGAGISGGNRPAEVHLGSFKAEGREGGLRVQQPWRVCFLCVCGCSLLGCGLSTLMGVVYLQRSSTTVIDHHRFTANIPPAAPQAAPGTSLPIIPAHSRAPGALRGGPPRAPPILPSCESSYPKDFDFEACLDWCPNKQSNCDRCKCRACASCRPPPPPAQSVKEPPLAPSSKEGISRHGLPLITGARLVVQKVRGDKNEAQLSEVRFNGGSAPVDYVMNPNGRSPAHQMPANMVDDSLATKWVDVQFGISGQTTLDFRFAAPVVLTEYELYTANDVPARDPIAWTLFGMVAGKEQELVELDRVTVVQVPVERLASYGAISL